MPSTLMPLRMVLGGPSTDNGSCTTRASLCVGPKYSLSFYLLTGCRVMLLWLVSWRGGTVTRLCLQVSILEGFAQIFGSTILGGCTLYSCVPSSRMVADS